jgi:hypothetical protein
MSFVLCALVVRLLLPLIERYADGGDKAEVDVWGDRDEVLWIDDVSGTGTSKNQ